MSRSNPITIQRVQDLVMANRAIRAPDYRQDHDESVRYTDLKKGLVWGADVIPALMGLFRVEKDVRDDQARGWTGFARHWRGHAMRLDVDADGGSGGTEPVLVVTAIYGRAGEASIEDADFGEIELPDAVPTREAWDERAKRYQAARRADDDDAPDAVKAYLGALTGWKQEVATQIDKIIRREVPEVRSAIKWHNPFYGVEDNGLFASIAPLSKKLKLTFLNGTSLDPVPPGGKQPDARWLDLREGEPLHEEQITSWVRQAAANPGWLA